MNCGEARPALGALVLGALDPGEAVEVHRHLAGCRGCRAVHDELRPLPAALALLDPAQVARLAAPGTAPGPAPGTGPDRAPGTPPKGMPGRVRRPPGAGVPPATAPPAGRAPRRGRRLAAAAIAAAVLAGPAAWLAVRDSRPPAASVLTGADPATGVRARVTVTGAAGGSRVALTLSGVPAGQHCRLLADARNGRQEVAASWVADYLGSAQVVGSVDLRPRDIARLVVQADDGRVLVTAPG